ncbi:Potassium transporter 23, partial [Tetrabaena socialis]
GTFALYSLLCRHIGIKPQGAPRDPASARSAASKASKAKAKAAAAARAQQQGSHSDGESDSEGEGEAKARGPRPWWQRFGVDGEAVRAFFRRSPRIQVAMWGVAVMATASLVGDGVLTPSISVLSAVSGLTVAVPDLGQDVIIGVTIGVLFVVFAIQPLGTGK